MTQPKFFDFGKITKDKGPLDVCSVSEKNLKVRIAELESQIKLISLDIIKLESKKIKMDYFIKRDAIDKHGTIFDQMQHIDPFHHNDESISLDRTLSSQYENNTQFQDAMKLVAQEEKLHMRHKKPEDWTVEMRYKIRSILEQNYAYYKISQDKYIKTYQMGSKHLEGLKSDLKKETTKLKALQTALKQLETQSNYPNLKQMNLKRT